MVTSDYKYKREQKIDYQHTLALLFHVGSGIESKSTGGKMVPARQLTERGQVLAWPSINNI